MDAIIKTAEYIEKKYSERYICKKDGGYLRQDWLVHQIIKILKKYPKILELISAEMSIEQIMGIINDFIANEIERRQLKLEKLRFILTEKWQYRSQETLLLLLLLGYCFHKSAIRIKNNRVSEGDYFKPYESEKVTSYMAYPMPPQSKNSHVGSIIKQLTESSCSASEVETDINYLTKISHTNNLDEIFSVNRIKKLKGKFQ